MGARVEVERTPRLRSLRMSTSRGCRPSPVAVGKRNNSLERPREHRWRLTEGSNLARKILGNSHEHLNPCKSKTQRNNLVFGIISPDTSTPNIGIVHNVRQGTPPSTPRGAALTPVALYFFSCSGFRINQKRIRYRLGSSRSAEYKDLARQCTVQCDELLNFTLERTMSAVEPNGTDSAHP